MKPGLSAKKTFIDIFKILVSLLFGGAILFWMYRNYDFRHVKDVMLHGMNWTWMLLSFPFGILAQMFRGWRWKQMLEPMDEHPRTSTCIHSIFTSYAISLVIPRIGEITRCGILKRYDGVSFPKALGAVVAERAVDSLLILALTGLTILMQIPLFREFFTRTNTNIDSILPKFSTTGYIVTAVCGVATIWLLYIVLRRFGLYNKVKGTFVGIGQGVISVRNVRNVPLFVFFSVGIWACYFLHYYLTFFCFTATSHLSLSCAMVTFIVGTIAVIVPTPNGAGPWHFAVKTMLILYGVAETDALSFVLIVHTVQTMLVVLIGIYGWIALLFTKKNLKTT